MLLVTLAVLPAIVLLVYIHRKDKIEKEPVGLLVKLFLLGAVMIIPAALIEYFSDEAVLSVLSEKSYAYLVIENFLLVALVEESSKYIILRMTWRDPNFNYTFDAVVYAVAVSLGFATLENILYVVSEGTIGVALMRGILSVPGHATDAVFMGWFYGNAKRCECRGDTVGCSANKRRALIVPTLVHGFYDFCLSADEDYFLLVFFVFEIIITVTAFRKVGQLSREDTPLPIGTPFGQYVRSGQQQYSQPYIYQQYGMQYDPYRQQYVPYQQPYDSPRPDVIIPPPQPLPPRADDFASRLYEEEQRKNGIR